MLTFKNRMPILNQKIFVTEQGQAFTTNMQQAYYLPANHILQPGVHCALKYAAGLPSLWHEWAPGDPPPSVVKPSDSPRATISLPAEALAFVARAASKEEVRYMLKGVYCHSDGEGAAYFVATDGHRLHRYRVDNTPALPADCLLPAGFVSLLPKKGTVTLELSDKSAQATLPCGGVLVTPYLDATFPDYVRVLPDLTAPHYQGAFNPATLKKAKPQVVASRGKGRKDLLIFTQGGALFRDEQELGSSGLWWDGAPLDRIGFDYRFMCDLPLCGVKVFGTREPLYFSNDAVDGVVMPWGI